AVQVGGDDGPGVGPEGLAQSIGVQVPVVGVEIDEDGPGAHGVDAEEVAAVVVGGEHDLVAGADLEGAQGEFDGKGAAAAGQGEGDAVPGGQALLQAAHVAAVVAAPGAVAVGRLEGGEGRVVGEGVTRLSIMP